VYDASGAKLTMRTYQGTTLLTCTNYSGSFVYEGSTPALTFLSSPEGRIVKKGNAFEYEYAISDHQGNTRVVFSSVTPAPVSKTATFEGDANDDVDEFIVPDVNCIVPSTAANHTPGGIGVARLNQNYKVGPGKSLRVYPGDVVNTEVWAYYESSSGFGTTSPALTVIMNAVASAFGGVSGGTGESGAIFNGVDNAFGAFGLAGNQGDNVPAAYLNYILFDQQYNVLDMGWRPVTTASNWNKAKISFDPIAIKEAGFMFVYLSYENESNNWVYFDDFNVTHTKTNIVQYNEYYPFGLTTANSWTRENTTGNQFLANGGTELNATSNLYDLEYRQYDPVLGRMNGVDPMATKYASITPYNFAFNDPVTFNDPSGADPYGYYEGAEPIFEPYTMWMYNPGYGWWQDDVIYQRLIGWSAPVARYAGPGLDWMFGKAGTGPAGSGSWQASTFGFSFNDWVNARIQISHIINGITDALTSKDNGIWHVNPVTGRATQLWSETKYREQLELQKYFSIDPNSLTTCNEPNCKHGIAKSGVVETAVGTVTAVAGELYYSEKAGTWMGKNFKIYQQTWGGNGSTGGKLKFGKKVSTGFKIGGYGLGILSAYDIRQQNKAGEISDKQMYIEQASNLFTTIGGIYGAAWGAGWEIGRGITKTEWYQEMKFNLFYDYWESKVGPPSRSNEELWIYFFKNYRP
jgi:RHS repeat-associated protein